MNRLLFALPFVALGLIAVGASMAYPPAGPLVVGLLLWHDLTRKDSQP